VLLEGDPAMLHLGEERFLERLHSYVQVASALRERIPDIDYVDLRFEQRVYVRPQRAATGGKRPSADGRTF
jgi:cell division septal protein FtsQ